MWEKCTVNHTAGKENNTTSAKHSQYEIQGRRHLGKWKHQNLMKEMSFEVGLEEWVGFGRVETSSFHDFLRFR